MGCIGVGENALDSTDLGLYAIIKEYIQRARYAYTSYYACHLERFAFIYLVGSCHVCFIVIIKPVGSNREDLSFASYRKQGKQGYEQYQN